MLTDYRLCPECGDERDFVQPVCEDGHGAGDCPEWACVDCGTAVWVGGLTEVELARPVAVSAA
jgi:hypothetical protein